MDMHLIYDKSCFFHHPNRSSWASLKAPLPVLIAIIFAAFSLALPGRAQASDGVPAFTPGSKAAALTPLVVEEEAAFTDPATEVTQTSAKLNATVNPDGVPVTACEFEYGTSTTPYESKVPCAQSLASLGTGTNPMPVSASATPLLANTTYHFRISSASATIASHGTDATFKTLSNPANPPTVLTEAPSSLTQTSATLNGTVNPNGEALTACRFEWDTGGVGTYTKSVACTPSSISGTSPVRVSAQLTGLAAGGAYHFRLVATSAGGTGTGAKEFLVMLPNPPTVVTGTASEVTPSTARLSATVNPNGGAVGECEFEYGTTTSYGSSAPCSSLPGYGTSAVAVSASLTGLALNTTYHFRISASNAGGRSSGSDATFATAEAAPTAVADAASPVAETSATLNASVNPNGAKVTECRFEYGTTTAYGSSVPCSSLPGSGASPVAVSASITGLTASTTYHYVISATDAKGTGRGSDETFRTLTPVSSSGGSTTPGPSTITPPPTGLPAPVLGRTANVDTVVGQVRIRPPEARAFVALSATRQVPYGTVIEAVHGEVSVVAAAPGGGTQKGEFFDGEFVLTQGRSGRVLATLTGGNFNVCPPAAGTAAARKARARSKFASRTHLVRRLWAEGHGNFSTKGRYAGGIVKGAQWLTEDMCSGTLILATRERVEVNDLVRHRQVQIVSGGGAYLAKSR
jgi:hypothetical protein